MASKGGKQIVQNWMPIPPEIIPGCPNGLEYLTTIDQIFLNQNVSCLELFSSCEYESSFRLLNSLGQDVYYATEESNCLLRQRCGAARPFTMSVMDNTQREVIHIDRQYRPFCQEVRVESPPGNVIGYVRQECTFIFPRFNIMNAEGDTVLKIKGPYCICQACAQFEVLTPDQKFSVGKISKQWAGLAKEYFSDADNFGIQFPMDLDVKMKAVMIGACFLIDFMFFESNGGLCC